MYSIWMHVIIIAFLLIWVIQAIQHPGLPLHTLASYKVLLIFMYKMAFQQVCITPRNSDTVQTILVNLCPLQCFTTRHVQLGGVLKFELYYKVWIFVVWRCLYAMIRFCCSLASPDHTDQLICHYSLSHDTQSIHNNDIHCLFHRLLILLSTLCFSKSSQDLLLVSNIVCLCISLLFN